MSEEKGCYGEFLLEEKFRSWVWRLRNFFVRVRIQDGHKGGIHASAMPGLLQRDVRRLDSENDGNREALRLMGSVANEERIDGEVETGNPDLRDQNHLLVDDLSYSSIMRKIESINVYRLCWPTLLTPTLVH